jgi:hypothetical protein
MANRELASIRNILHTFNMIQQRLVRVSLRELRECFGTSETIGFQLYSTSYYTLIVITNMAELNHMAEF